MSLCLSRGVLVRIGVGQNHRRTSAEEAVNRRNESTRLGVECSMRFHESTYKGSEDPRNRVANSLVSLY
ncbi:hypothetical protein PM082_010088 [Marasmius tenuissimus]|nr:hypothetical protein PM082_010088 [Marasmius tenuissimus]